MIPKTMYYYNETFIPSKREPLFNRYDNKQLKDWNCDDFSTYIFDHLAAKYENRFNFVPEGSFIKADDFIIDYLEELPNIKNKNVYLYGVWEVFKGRILNKKEIDRRKEFIKIAA